MRKLTPTQAIEVQVLASTMREKHADLRKGQSFFNALYEMYPDIADEVRGTPVDPFHKDGRIKICLELITVSQR